jgi:hypothetical protein
MSQNNECKLNSQKDWERWNRQFQSTAVAADLWDVIKGREDPIRKPIKPNISSFPRSAASATPAQTRSQSQGIGAAQVAEDSQATVQQDEPVEFADLTTAGQKSFTTAITMYENDLKAYNNQRLAIQKLVDLVN